MNDRTMITLLKNRKCALPRGGWLSPPDSCIGWYRMPISPNGQFTILRTEARTPECVRARLRQSSLVAGRQRHIDAEQDFVASSASRADMGNIRTVHCYSRTNRQRRRRPQRLRRRRRDTTGRRASSRLGRHNRHDRHRLGKRRRHHERLHRGRLRHGSRPRERRL